MVTTRLDHPERRQERRRQLVADLLHHGADPLDLDGLTLEALFELRWRLLHDEVGARRRHPAMAGRR